MPRYSEERKAAVIEKMMPPRNTSIPKLAEETGISDATLYNWRKRARLEGFAVPPTINTTGVAARPRNVGRRVRIAPPARTRCGALGHYLVAGPGPGPVLLPVPDSGSVQPQNRGLGSA